jgi:hypothetical protein
MRYAKRGGEERGEVAETRSLDSMKRDAAGGEELKEGNERREGNGEREL